MSRIDKCSNLHNCNPKTLLTAVQFPMPKSSTKSLQETKCIHLNSRSAAKRPFLTLSLLCRGMLSERPAVVASGGRDVAIMNKLITLHTRGTRTPPLLCFFLSQFPSVASVPVSFSLFLSLWPLSVTSTNHFDSFVFQTFHATYAQVGVTICVHPGSTA